MNDPIADMLSRIHNAQNVRAGMVDIPYSMIKEKISKILVEEGYVAKFDRLKRMDKKFLRLSLKYRDDKKGVICKMKRVSKSGRRIYSDVRSLPRVQGGFGTCILSTSKGVMTDETARSKKLGGEVLCYIW
ncbi:MAG: 30S ribosomal protein S8 [Candidatus Margulisiibacteriota bacterium]